MVGRGGGNLEEEVVGILRWKENVTDGSMRR